MHDFGVSRLHTVIMDLPLSLDPLNLLKGRPVVSYDPTARSRYGIFPRYQPEKIRWFETNPCCIFHNANTWDSVEVSNYTGERAEVVNMLVCRLTSASLVFHAGDITSPVPSKDIPMENKEEEQCRLYYYQFVLTGTDNVIRHQWAVSAVDFEFPMMRQSQTMSAAKFIYGCSSDSTFGAALGKAAKINALTKIDVETLIRRGIQNPPQQIKGCLDTRSSEEVLASEDPHDPIKIFKMPPGWYAQESRFVPRENGLSEDDGWIVCYVFDESQLDSRGECMPDATSELWIIDARTMKDIVAKVQLPQRVPYGLHGAWFSEEEIDGQRPLEGFRSLPMEKLEAVHNATGSAAWQLWMGLRKQFELFLA